MAAPSRIHAEELFAKLESGENGLIVDVRSPEEYRSLHAQGAVLLPLEKVNEEAVADSARAAGKGPDVKLYFICHSGRRATEACSQILVRFPTATVIEGGTLAWAQAGLPVVQGENP